MVAERRLDTCRAEQELWVRKLCFFFQFFSLCGFGGDLVGRGGSEGRVLCGEKLIGQVIMMLWGVFVMFLLSLVVVVVVGVCALGSGVCLLLLSEIYFFSRGNM